MATTLLHKALQLFGHDNLPMLWQADDAERFSAQKTLYNYQQDALKNAIVALWLYYGKNEECRYRPGEPQTAEDERRRQFAALLNERADKEGEETEAPRDVFYREKDRAHAVLAERLSPPIRARYFGEPVPVKGFPPPATHIPFERLVNRMGFWMATGSGKTLVMLKLIENLRRLMDAGLIPPRKILILAPSDLLLRQIQQTAREYNRHNPRPIDMINLRDWRAALSGRDAVFYHRADNIAGERKKALIDWRDFENNGEWYVLLDEAHRGQAEDSKRQAYYSLLARAGFLFNFSATFTDREDIMTTAAKFNLANFAAENYGKHIRLCGAEFRAFDTARKGDHNDDEKKRIVLQSVLALALVKKSIGKLRAAAEQAGINPPYHNPLMVTLTNSVNTNENDLRAFFNTLVGLATPGGLDAELFKQTRRDLADDLRQGEFKFELGKLPPAFARTVEKLTIKDARRAVFLTDSPGALEIITGEPGKELAIQLRGAAEPFGLIRIGETRKWLQYAENAGIVIGKTVSDKSFFDGLETSNISVLMGSRAFFESWDSVRPNVINFINIGKGKAAVKFIVQSVGRGVRIRPIPPPKECRRRIAAAENQLSDAEKSVFFGNKSDCDAAESLFVFAAKRDAIQKALEGLEAESPEADKWTDIGHLFKRNPRPQIGKEEMSLLVPHYLKRQAAPDEKWQPLKVSPEDFPRINGFVAKLPDGMLAAAYGKTPAQISAFRAAAGEGGFVSSDSAREIATTPAAAVDLAFLHPRIEGIKINADIRALREDDEEPDIVHFRQVKIALPPGKAQIFRDGLRGDTMESLAAQVQNHEITPAEFAARVTAANSMQNNFPELKMRRLAEHYYAPLVATKDEKAAYIRHIVKTESEAAFLAKLESALPDCGRGWDGWMFSKLDENTDGIYIPYQDGGKKRRFHPDFVFWMCRGNDYHVVFVDPKGTAHTGGLLRLDGYCQLFEKNGARRQFRHDRWNVTVAVFFFNSDSNKAPEQYRRFWAENPADIFR